MALQGAAALAANTNMGHKDAAEFTHPVQGSCRMLVAMGITRGCRIQLWHSPRHVEAELSSL